MVVLVDDDPGSSALGSTPIGDEEPEGVLPSVRRRNVVKGGAPEMTRPRSATHAPILRSGAST